MDQLESLLRQLCGELRKTSDTINESDDVIQRLLHDPSQLPTKRLSLVASETIDLLNSVERSLTPSTLVLADHFLGYTTTPCLVAAVQLGVPDLLKDSPLPIPKLAEAAKTNPLRLSQVLRTLHANGIFDFDPVGESYANNRVSELLIKDHWTQWHLWVRLYGESFFRLSRGLPAACGEHVRRTPAQIEYDSDQSIIEYFQQQGMLENVMKTLGAGAIAQTPGLVADYPWDELDAGPFIDIGAGNGALVASVLRAHPALRAGIFEISSMLEICKANFDSKTGEFKDVGSRVYSFSSGDFFQSVPESRFYTIKWCLHNWGDEESKQILTNIRHSIRATDRSRLIIFESVVTNSHSNRLALYADTNMWISTNGQERTLKDWSNLAEASGWIVHRIFPLRNAWFSAIELRPAYSETDKIAEPGQSKLLADPWAQIDVGSIDTEMRFLEPWEALRYGNPYIRTEPAPGYPRTNLSLDKRKVKVHNARPVQSAFSLDGSGFEFVKDAAGGSTQMLAAICSSDKNQVETRYYEHVQSLVKQVTGADRVIIFDHTVRKQKSPDDAPNGTNVETPATIVHCDQSAGGALRRLRQNIGADESLESVLQGRVQMLNVWRPLTDPVEDWPLAVMDTRTLSRSNIHATDLWRGEYELRGQTVSISHSTSQRWWYLGGHRPDEVTMIKIWDTDTSPSTATLCAHSAFHNPTAPVGAPCRESIEVRCIAIHGMCK